MEIIMAIVAVLLIHMDRNHVGAMMPNSNLKHRSKVTITQVSGHGNTGQRSLWVIIVVVAVLLMNPASC
jgi:hypothetical protein